VPGLATLEGKVIGIIDNGQANSTTMFQELAQLIQEKFIPRKSCSRPSRPTCRAHRNRSWKNLKPLRRGDHRFRRLRSCTSWSVHDAIELQKKGKPTVTLCQSIFMELARTEAKFFGIAKLPLVEIPHHPSGGARPGEHRADAEGAVDEVNRKLTLAVTTTETKTRIG